jgi:hypothetical protein
MKASQFIEASERRSRRILEYASYSGASYAPARLVTNDKNLKKVRRFKDHREVVIERRVGEREWHLLRLPQVTS